MSMQFTMLSLLTLVITSFLASACVSDIPQQPDTVGDPVAIEVGDAVPNFTLDDTSGTEISLAQFRGKVVYLDFWASWCGPCRVQMPEMKQIWEKYRDKDFVILGISLDENQNDWKTYIRNESLSWYHMYDGLPATSGGPTAKFDVREIPRTYLIDKQGVVVAKNLRGGDLREEIERQLAK